MMTQYACIVACYVQVLVVGCSHCILSGGLHAPVLYSLAEQGRS